MANENGKKRASRATLVGLIVLSFALVAISFLHVEIEDPTVGPLVGDVAPDFPVELEPGKLGTLSDLRGKVVLVNFWAYWCGPCLEEMASLRQLEKHYEKKDFVLLLVHVGDEKSEALKVPNLPKNLIFDTPVSALASYGVSALPHTVLIDKNGIVQAEFLGPRDWTASSTLEQLDPLL